MGYLVPLVIPTMSEAKKRYSVCDEEGFSVVVALKKVQICLPRSNQFQFLSIEYELDIVYQSVAAKTVVTTYRGTQGFEKIDDQEWKSYKCLGRRCLPRTGALLLLYRLLHQWHAGRRAIFKV